ncbi:penicillin-binding protein activator [Algicola sagamiensis]|uniref:penicillin-binding protein activator n=1 Tax=Algicola sagamiensis TaxID=163869 RepID=UPI0003796C38|nr:penicillin-binding protein activator [Algicola sagamiensis]
MKNIKQKLAYIATLLILAGCQAPPKQAPVTTQPVASTPSQPTTQPEVQPDERQDEETGIYTGSPRLRWLNEAVKQNRLDHYAKTYLITRHLLEQQLLEGRYQILAQILNAKASIHLGYTDDIRPIPVPKKLRTALWLEDYVFVMTHPKTLNKTYLDPLLDLYTDLKPSSYEIQTQDVERAIWQIVQVLRIQELKKLSQLHLITLQPWLELNAIVKETQHYSNAQVLGRIEELPFSASFQHELKTQLSSIPLGQTEKVVLLLPFSGKYAQLAKSTRNGILAYLTKHRGRQPQNLDIAFIDSNQEATQVQAQLETLAPDAIIGPLIKRNIQRLEPVLPKDRPIIFLNRANIEPAQISANHLFFSLSMEDELKQAITFFEAENIQHPALFLPETKFSQTLASTFMTDWRKKDPTRSVEVYYYKDKRDMKKKVEHLLHTDSSQQRIKTMKWLAGAKIKTEKRNRRDIDAIYLIGDPTQTRLFKPFVEVNTSVFSPRIPLYASSRSHSYKQDKTSEEKDLSGVQFSQMPWLLNQQKYIQLKKIQKDDSIKDSKQSSELFAMGYDAASILKHLRAMLILDHFAIKGMTGELKREEGNLITRKLVWAKYEKGRIVAIPDHLRKREAD